MIKRIKTLIIIFTLLLAGILFWFTYIGGTAYLYARYLEGKWFKADPKTRQQLESHLSLYSLHQIDPKESMWGNRYKLKDGEVMMQYRILWHRQCPLDVVYDAKYNIIRIFTSYE